MSAAYEEVGTQDNGLVGEAAVAVVSASQAAKVLKISITRLHALLDKKRIQGAYKCGNGRGVWLIPVGKNGKPRVLPSTAPVGRPRKKAN